MKRWLAQIPAPLRTPLMTAAGLLGVLALTQLVPSASAGGGHTPAAILFRGLVAGLVQSLTAVGIVLVYRTTRVVNFAQTAIGVGGAVLCFDLLEMTGLPFAVDLVAGLACAALLGTAFDLIFGRRFFDSPRLVLTVLTIVAAGFLGSAIPSFFNRLPFFTPVDQRSYEQLAGTVKLRTLLPFSDRHFTVGGVQLFFGFPELFAIVAAVAALVAIGVFLRVSRFGVAVRAMAENTERAALLGISVGALSTLVWTLSGLLSGASAMLTGFIGTPSDASGIAPELLLPALAAAVIGRMRSIPTTVCAAIGIALLSETIRYQQGDLVPYIDGLLLLVVVAGLLSQRDRGGRSEKGVTSSWKATEELRPIPRELLGIGSLRIARWALVGVGLAFVIVYPFVVSTNQLFTGQVVALDAIVGLSLVILTGWAGQVSLGQFGFVAVGALVAGSLSTHIGVPFWIAVPLATAVTAGIATLIGIPALRIPGLFLAVATFAFAVAARAVLFDTRFFGWLQPAGEVKRPSLFVLGFDDERAMYFLCAAALVAAIVAVVNLRRSRFGRVLIAVRENEANAEAAGVSALRMKLTAFAISGALAGFAGALFAFQERGVTGDSFAPQASIGIFIQVVLGGVSTVGGALLGSLYTNVTTQLLNNFADLEVIFGSGAALILLYIAPGGLISVVTRMRDAVLRIVAQRHQLVVPSLFADMDPEALEMRLIPMAAAEERQGLTGIAARYQLRSRTVAVRHDGRRRDGDSAAIAAASSAAERTGEEPATIDPLPEGAPA